MIIRCPGCSGALEYDVISDKMSCSHCGNSYSMWELENMEGASRSEAATSEDEAEDSASIETMEIECYRCTACGAELMINDVESATFCAYCGQPTIVYDRVSKTRKPQYIIPFSVTRQKAVTLIKESFKKGFFVPNEIKEFKPEVVRGIYIPYRLVDLEYRDSALISAEIKKGRNSVTRYFYRDAKADYMKMPVDASVTLQDASSVRLEPYELNGMREFTPEYLSGYYADCSDEDEKNIGYKAQKRAGELFEGALFNTVRGSRKKIVMEHPRILVKKSDYVLLPAWFMVFKYKGMSKTIMVNGQTGKVVGAVPYAASAVWSFFTVLAAIFSLFTVGLAQMLYRNIEVASDAFFNITFFVALFIAVIGSKAISLYKSYKKSRDLTADAGFSMYVKKRQEV